LRNVCREFLARTDASLEDISLDTDTGKRPAEKANPRAPGQGSKKNSSEQQEKNSPPEKAEAAFWLA
jgi:hypothetical protein